MTDGGWRDRDRNAATARRAIEPSENFGELWMEAMRRGDFAAAFAVSDAVLAARDSATRDDPRLPYHQRWVWDGRPLAGRHVLVRCYHGLGDTIQFCRYLEPLRSVTNSVTVEAPAALLPLLQGLAGVDRWIAFDADNPTPAGEGAGDCDVEIMELAHALRLTPAQVAPAALTVQALRLAAVPAVGLCWRAGDWEPARSVALNAVFSAAVGPGVTAVSLQRGLAASEADGRFVNPGDDDLDLVRTARLILGTGRVVTVDTAVAHLAGTLGHPTWLLLKADADWRWHSPDWYPSVRTIRQTVAGDWSGPLATIRAWAST